MANKPTKVTSVDLAHRVDNEGLSYAVQHYYGENIECVDSPKMEELWKNAYRAIVDLDNELDKIRETDGYEA